MMYKQLTTGPKKIRSIQQTEMKGKIDNGTIIFGDLIISHSIMARMTRKKITILGGWNNTVNQLDLIYL